MQIPLVIPNMFHIRPLPLFLIPYLSPPHPILLTTLDVPLRHYYHHHRLPFLVIIPSNVMLHVTFVIVPHILFLPPFNLFLLLNIIFLFLIPPPVRPDWILPTLVFRLPLFPFITHKAAEALEYDG